MRGYDLFGAEVVIDEIWSCIKNADVVIADCTSRNPNVFYEIGIAHTLGTPVILITQDIEDVPMTGTNASLCTTAIHPVTQNLRSLREALGFEASTQTENALERLVATGEDGGDNG